MASWDTLLIAADQAEDRGAYRQALGYYNELYASAKRVGHEQMMEYAQMKIDAMSALL